MRKSKMKKVIATHLTLFAVMTLKIFAQPLTNSNTEVKAVKLSKLNPSLQKSVAQSQLSSRGYLKNANQKLDRSAYYNHKEGIFYIINRNREVMQSFDLKSRGLDRPGHNKLSPDGTAILSSIFNKKKGGASPLYLLKIDGTIEEVLAAENEREQILQPSWAGDGKAFACLKSIRGVSHEIWAKNIESGKEVLVEKVSVYEGSCGNPVMFNRHHKVLYKKANRNRPSRMYKELWVYDLENGEKSKIYEGLAETTFPIISPDDLFIGTDTGEYFSIYNINGELVRTLKPGSNIKPSWSPDGLHIAYLKGKVNPVTEIAIEQHICVININSGLNTDLTPVPGLEIYEFKWFNSLTVVY